MKMHKRLLAPFAVALMAYIVPATAIYPTWLTFQDVTFQAYAVNSDTLRLTMYNADKAAGNWTGVTDLYAFEIKDIGGATGGSIVGGENIGSSNGSDWRNLSGGVTGSALGCTGGGGLGGCFNYNVSGGLALSDTMVWYIHFTGSGLDFDAPELKVQFGPNLKKSHKPQGDLLSQNISTIPEPEIYAMMGIGLGLLGWVGRRKKLKEAAAA